MYIDRKIISTQFLCELSSCKGACCTFPGGSGAPVRDDEREILQACWEQVRADVPEEHRREVELYGLFEHDGEELTLRCYDDRACVFVCYDGDVAKCAIQNRYYKGDLDWEKPLSCHLFPIRVRRGKTDRLRFEEFSECRSALDAGREQKLPLVTFLEAPLRRAFGEDFYLRLREKSDAYHGTNGEDG